MKYKQRVFDDRAFEVFNFMRNLAKAKSLAIWHVETCPLDVRRKTGLSRVQQWRVMHKMTSAQLLERRAMKGKDGKERYYYSVTPNGAKWYCDFCDTYGLYASVHWRDMARLAEGANNGK